MPLASVAWRENSYSGRKENFQTMGNSSVIMSLHSPGGSTLQWEGQSLLCLAPLSSCCRLIVFSIEHTNVGALNVSDRITIIGTAVFQLVFLKENKIFKYNKNTVSQLWSNRDMSSKDRAQDHVTGRCAGGYRAASTTTRSFNFNHVRAFIHMICHTHTIEPPSAIAHCSVLPTLVGHWQLTVVSRSPVRTSTY